jgi:hypothetical protein
LRGNSTQRRLPIMPPFAGGRLPYDELDLSLNHTVVVAHFAMDAVRLSHSTDFYVAPVNFSFERC